MTTFEQPERPGIHALAITWMLLLPLLFFGVSGHLRLDLSKSNNPYVARFEMLSYNSGETASSGIELIALLMAVIPCLSRLSSVLSVIRENKVIVALAALAAASCMWSQSPFHSLTQAIVMMGDMMCALYLTARFDSQRRMQLLQVVGWAMVSLNVVTSLLFPQYGLDHRGAGAEGAWIGICPHKNLCCLTTVFLLSPAFYHRPAGRLSSVTRFGFLALSLVVTGMTQSRTGWIVAAVLLLYVISVRSLRALGRRDKVNVIILFLAIAAAGGLILHQFYGVMAYLLGKDATFSGRTEIWKLAIASAWKHPVLGYGYAAFWSGLQGESANVSLAGHWMAPSAHDGFLNVWLELGGAGLALVVIMIVQGLRNGWICLLRGKSVGAEWYLCVVILTIVANIAELTIMVPNSLTWLMFLVACIGLREEVRTLRNQTSEHRALVPA